MKAAGIGLGELGTFAPRGPAEPEQESRQESEQDFARMLAPHPSAATPPRPKPEPRRNEPESQAQPQPDDAPPRRAKPGTDPASAAVARAKHESRNRQDNTAGAGRTVATSPPRSEAHTTAEPEDDLRSDATTPDRTQDSAAADIAWPPPGLAGLALTPAALAPMGGPAGVLPGLPPEAAAGIGSAALSSTVQAGGGPVPTSPAAGQPGALPPFAAALAQPAAQLATLPQAGAMTALADAHELLSPEPGAVALPAAAPAPNTVARAAEPAIFDAAPTPTPHLHGDDFDEAVGARTSWLAEQKIGHAHIKITPNDLGPIEVLLQLDGDKITASFTSAHAEVRHALEQSLPRLREMLGQQGFQLANADVGQQHQPSGHGRTLGNAGLEPALGDDVGSAGILPLALRQRGLLDAYA